MKFFFEAINFFNLSLKSKVSKRFIPGNFINFVSSGRCGYGGPEIIVTLWPIFFKASDKSLT